MDSSFVTGKNSGSNLNSNEDTSLSSETQKRITPERITHEQIIEAPQTYLSLPRRFVGKLTPGSTTPSIKNVEHWRANNSGAVTVTNLVDGQEGQSLYILGDGFTTLQNGTTMFMQGAADLLLATDTVYHLVMMNGKWYQI